MRMSAGILVLALSSALVGCNGQSAVLPTGPASAPAPPAAATVAAERWNLTTTFISVTGPEACVSDFSKNVGRTHAWLMLMNRAGESLHLAVSNPGEVYEYVGSVVTEEFSASSAAYFGAIVCGGVRFDFRAEEQVSGRVSSDGQTLTAEEVDSYRLASGETVSFRYEWSATQQ